MQSAPRAGVRLHEAPANGPDAALPRAVHLPRHGRVRARVDGYGVLCVGGATHQRRGVLLGDHGPLLGLGCGHFDSLRLE